MQISEKAAMLLENGWEIHDEFETVLGNNGKDTQIPIGLKPGQICREVDGLFLVYGGTND